MQELLTEFLEEEEAKNLDSETMRKRRMVMKWLDEWAEKPVQEFSWKDIRDFMKHLQSGGACDGTVSSYMGQVSQLFEYLEKEGHFSEETNPRENITYTDYLDYKTTEARKALRETKDYIALSQEEAEKLLANATDPKLRNTVMLKLQLETGPRAGELVSVRLDDVDIDSQTVKYESLKKDDTLEYRTLEFSDGVAIMLNQWINEGYRDRFTSAENSPYLFVSRSAPKLSPSGYNRIVKKAATEAGIQQKTRIDSNGNQEWKVRSHVLRHTYAENMVRNGCDISRLADLMGHESIETVRKYLDHDDETLREAQRNYSPSFSVGD